MAQQISTPTTNDELDLGDLVVILLASTLTGLRDRLLDDGFPTAADLVADLTIRCDHYLAEKG